MAFIYKIDPQARFDSCVNGILTTRDGEYHKVVIVFYDDLVPEPIQDFLRHGIRQYTKYCISLLDAER